MITLETLQTELKSRVNTSIKFKNNLDSAKTKTKQSYYMRKLTTNNDFISRLLTTMERYTKDKDEQTTDAPRHSEKES